MGSAVRATIVIDRPIGDVFAVLTNVENTARWFPAKVREWWVTPPPHGVGAIRRARVTMGWVTTENDAVTTVYEPPYRAGMKGISRNAPFEVTLTFAEVPGGTRVDSVIELTIRGPARAFGNVFMRWYGRAWDEGLVRLKSMMEAGEL